MTNGMETLDFNPGDRATYIDSNGNVYAALIRKWWGGKFAAANLTYVTDEGTVTVDAVPRGDGATPGRHWRAGSEPVMAVTIRATDIPTFSPPPIPAPPPVTGYRQLTQEQVALLNEVKAAFNAVGAVLDKLSSYTACPSPSPSDDPEKFVADGRCLAIARTEAQTASMWASRAITRPSSFA